MFASMDRTIREGRIAELGAERVEHGRAVLALQNEIDELKELVETYRQGTATKDLVISNMQQVLEDEVRGLRPSRSNPHALAPPPPLTTGMLPTRGWQRARATRQELEFERRRRALEEQEEHAKWLLAVRHHRRRRLEQGFAAFHQQIKAKWREKIDEGCQQRAREVCLALTADYEARLGAVNRELERQRETNDELERRRVAFEEKMKKAFMRGVSALNMEAMAFAGAEGVAGEPPSGLRTHAAPAMATPDRPLLSPARLAAAPAPPVPVPVPVAAPTPARPAAQAGAADRHVARPHPGRPAQGRPRVEGRRPAANLVERHTY